MYAFNFSRPDSLADGVAAVRDAEDGKFIAGGMSMLPTLKMRLAQPTDLIDVTHLAELQGIRREGDFLLIGAATTHADVAASELVREHIPALADLAGLIGDGQVRNRGTLGGSIANNDPAADYPAALVGLAATVHTDRRQIAGDDFFQDMFETALEHDELITGVAFRIPDKAAYTKFPNPASRYAVVGVMVAVHEAEVRVAVTGAGACVFRVPEMETALAARFEPAALEGMTVPADDFNEDLHASAEYRAHLVGVMARRAVAAAAGG